MTSSSKISARKKMISKRDSLSTLQRQLWPSRAITHLENLSTWSNANVIGCYIPHGSEANALSLVEHSTQRGAKIAYPRVTKKNMTFHLWQRGEPTESSIGGVRQPTAQAPEFPVEDIELFLTPLLACGGGGQRLGYGGGYYDQVFSTAKGYRLGLGYDFQRTNGWENEPHDWPIHAFLSESGLVFFP